MKKIIFLFSFLISLVGNSQTIWNFTDGADCTPYYDKCWTASDDDFNSEHPIMSLRDTSFFTVYMDTICFLALDQFNISDIDPENIMWSDTNGIVHSSPVDSLNITWSQIVDAPNVSPLPTVLSSGSRNFNQAYQISASDYSAISVSVQISCNLSLTGGQAGNIQLQISANGSSGWITVSQLTASNTGTLTIGLNTTQVSGGQLVYEGLPAGYYWRILTTNTTGTPTYTFNGGFEKVY